MLQMAAIIEFGQIAEQAETADGAPAHELDETVGRIGIGSDEHGAAGVFAVVKGEEEAAAFVPFGFVVATKDKSASFELNDANENSEKIAEMAERFEDAIGESTDISSEAEAENVEGKNFAPSMGEADEIDRTGAIFEECFERRFDSFAGEVAKKRVAGTERKKAKGDTFGVGIAGEDAVEHFVGSAIATDGEKFSVTLFMSFASELHSVALSGRRNHINFQALFTEARESWSGKLGGFAATGGGIDDGEKTVFGRGHWGL